MWYQKNVQLATCFFCPSQVIKVEEKVAAANFGLIITQSWDPNLPSHPHTFLIGKLCMCSFFSAVQFVYSSKDRKQESLMSA